MNDPYSPIQGISLERYAELSAEISDHLNDTEAQMRIVESLGVSRADWQAVVAGWTARMQDMSLMGQVATRYMSLYQAALSKKKGSVDVSYDDWVALNAAVQAYGIEGALRAYGIDMTTWTMIAGTWNSRIGQNMMAYQSFHPSVTAEAQRIRSGAAHRPVTFLRQAGGSGSSNAATPAATPQAATPQAAAQQYQNQMVGLQVQADVAQAVAQANAQAAAAYGDVSKNVGFLGRGVLGAMGMGAIAKGIGPGMTVMVAWSNGNRYPGQVVQVSGGKVLVAFQNGQQMWVPENAVSAQ
jgi:hypothetical protein